MDEEKKERLKKSLANASNTSIDTTVIFSQ